MSELRARLTSLSRNLWWSWHRELGEVFATIDIELWRKVRHNPVAFLADIDDSQLKKFENSGSLLTAVIRAERGLSQEEVAALGALPEVPERVAACARGLEDLAVVREVEGAAHRRARIHWKVASPSGSCKTTSSSRTRSNPASSTSLLFVSGG